MAVVQPDGDDLPAGHTTNGDTFTPLVALQGKYLVAEVTANNADGTTKALSNTVGPIAAS